MTLGEKLYGLRKKQGLSQEQLAESLNVSRQSISKWEGNVTYPEADKLVALSEYFQVSLDYLMKADITDESHPRESSESQEPEGQRIGNAVERSEEQDEAGTGKESNKQELLLAGLTLCIAALIGLIFFGLVTIFLPSTTKQIGASSIITLNGTALVMLLFLGMLIIGVTLIIRFVRRK